MNWSFIVKQNKWVRVSQLKERTRIFPKGQGQGVPRSPDRSEWAVIRKNRTTTEKRTIKAWLVSDQAGETIFKTTQKSY